MKVKDIANIAMAICAIVTVAVLLKNEFFSSDKEKQSNFQVKESMIENDKVSKSAFNKVDLNENSQADKVKIYDFHTKKRDPEFEIFFNEIFDSNNFENIYLNGTKEVIITRNKTIKSELRATIQLKLEVNSHPVIFPIIYGRGESKQEAINHALSFNRPIIINILKNKL